MDDTEGDAPIPRWVVTYTLTRKDMVAFKVYYAKRKRRWLTYLGFGVGAFLVALSTWTKVAGAFHPDIVLASIVTGVFASVVMAVVQQILFRTVRVSPIVATVIVGDGMIVRTGKSVRYENVLRSLHDIVRGKGITYFFTTPSEAIVVPDRGFKSPGEAAACADYAIGCLLSQTGIEPRTIATSPFAVTFALDDDAIIHRTYSRLGRKRSLKPMHFIELISHPILALIGTVMGIFFLQDRRPIDWSRLIVFLYPIIVAARLYIGYGRAGIIKRARQAEGNEPQTFQVTPIGLEMSGSKGSSLIKWPVVKRIEEDDKAIYIDLINTKWFMIPTAAFLSPGHHRSFVDAAIAYREGREPSHVETESWPPRPAGNMS